jgi:hypothetical protein
VFVISERPSSRETQFPKPLLYPPTHLLGLPNGSYLPSCFHVSATYQDHHDQLYLTTLAMSSFSQESCCVKNTVDLHSRNNSVHILPKLLFTFIEVFSEFLEDFQAIVQEYIELIQSHLALNPRP